MKKLMYLVLTLLTASCSNKAPVNFMLGTWESTAYDLESASRKHRVEDSTSYSTLEFREDNTYTLTCGNHSSEGHYKLTRTKLTMYPCAKDKKCSALYSFKSFFVTLHYEDMKSSGGNYHLGIGDGFTWSVINNKEVKGYVVRYFNKK